MATADEYADNSIFYKRIISYINCLRRAKGVLMMEDMHVVEHPKCSRQYLNGGGGGSPLF